MGLAKLKEAPKSSRPSRAVVDLAPLGIEGSLTFRAPAVADFFPQSEKKDTALLNCPSLLHADGALMTQVILLAECYIPEPEERENAIAIIAGLCRDNMEAFLGLVSLFSEHFPMGLAQAKADAGNDSGQ